MSPSTFAFPQVALDFMNRDHAAFAEHCGKMLDLLDSPVAVETVTGLLDELLRHTREHFAEEERVMQKSGFPPYPMHKGEHDRVLADMAAQGEKWRSDNDVAALRQWLGVSVAAWFSNHVSTMDFITAEFAFRKQA